MRDDDLAVMLAMKASPHFTFLEFFHSDTAERSDPPIDNLPPDDEFNEVCANIRKLCVNVLEPIREMLGVPIKVTSGYRCKELNDAVGGVDTSQHRKGQAADIVPFDCNIHDTWLKIKTSGQKYDQLIDEYGDWIHVSWSDKPRQQAFRK